MLFIMSVDNETPTKLKFFSGGSYITASTGAGLGSLLEVGRVEVPAP